LRYTTGMRIQSAMRFRVALLYPNALAAVQAQVRQLGESISAREFRSYIDGAGPVAEFAPDDRRVGNPDRPKAWHLGRVKYFYQSFMNGTPVEPIEVVNFPGRGWIVSDGAHRLLGAHFANKRELDVIVSRGS
jgi:hypothetical protein